MRAAERSPSPSQRLQRYRDKRDFGATPEPAPEAAAPRGPALQFVVQRHQARRLHYDFRLELDGVLLSWAVPKEPSLDPADKRLAVRTEDHPLAYAGFEGRIPEGHYGAGIVELWDRGRWRPRGDAHEGLARGKLAFELEGQRLRGAFELVRTKSANARQESWLLFRKREGAFAPAAASAAAPAAALDLPTGPLPARLAPQLASLAEASPAVFARLDAEHWLLETKFDGYRVLARLEDGRAQLFTRNGHDWTERLPLLAKAIESLPIGSAWLDGEIVVPAAHDAQARGDFNALQNAFERGGAAASKAILYWLFDLPWFDGHDLRETPLQARRELLRQLLEHSAPRGRKAAPSPLRFSAEIDGDAAQSLHAACAAGGEGVIAKRRDAPYREGRSDSWLKLKCRRRQEFVVIGYSPRSDDARSVGSLSLAVYDDAGTLLPAGRVGTGFSSATARALMRRLQPLREGRAATPQAVAPRCVVEVEFAEWTPAGQVRQASFVAVREDKPPEAIRREAAAPLPPASPSPSPAPAPAGLRVTHGERVIDARSGTTKLDLIQHYERVADVMLEELQGRAVALLRAPQGVGGQTFFQKHAQAATLPGVRVLDAKLWPGHEPLLEIRSREGLLGAAQMNVVEFHTWNSRTRSMARPDRMVFDLDPGEGVGWEAVREGAQLVRAMLAELGLQAWLKTSGGKGLHVVVPIAARWPFDTVKGFSQAIVRHLAQTLPDRFVARSGPKNRIGRIFVDYLRNGEGATTVAAYSARARPGLGVSMPLPWEALASISGSAHWSVADAAAHLAHRAADPWADIDSARQSLAAPMRRLGHRPG